jgi:hypothetical protein
LLLLLLPFAAKSQKWVADTLTINFGKAPQQCSFRIDTAIDYRNQFPEFVSVFEQKKWLFFPVDQVVKTALPLGAEMKAAYQPISALDSSYNINIREFYISNTPSAYMRDLQLFSTLELYKSNGSEGPQLLGTFYYETKLSQKKKQAITDGYETLIDNWNKQLSADVVAIEQGIDKFTPEKYYHFRRGITAVKRNFYTSAEVFGGLNFWGVDGELWFSEPEGNRIFNRGTGMLRYVNHPTFEAIAIGRGIRHWNYRVTNKWLFTHKMAFLIGFNKWKDMATAHHKLEEIALFDLSFTQQINLNQFDKTGVVFGVGLMEDLHYIIYYKPEFKIGLTLNCAYKF